MNKIKKFRIYKKSGEGVLVKNPITDEMFTMPWEEFNNTFEIVDDIFFVPKKDVMDKVIPKIEFIKEHLAVLLMITTRKKLDAGTKLTHAGILGGIAQEWSKKFNSGPAEMLELFQIEKQAMQQQLEKMI